MRQGGWRRAAILAATIWAAVLTTGCGERAKYPTFKVSGKVTLDGAPLEKGSIVFRPTGEGQDGGGVIENGEYTVAKSPQGKVKVFITATKETGKTIEVSGKSRPETVNRLPAKYAAGIEQEITQSRSDLNFELSSK